MQDACAALSCAATDAPLGEPSAPRGVPAVCSQGCPSVRPWLGWRDVGRAAAGLWCAPGCAGRERGLPQAAILLAPLAGVHPPTIREEAVPEPMSARGSWLAVGLVDDALVSRLGCARPSRQRWPQPRPARRLSLLALDGAACCRCFMKVARCAGVNKREVQGQRRLHLGCAVQLLSRTAGAPARAAPPGTWRG